MKKLNQIVNLRAIFPLMVVVVMAVPKAASAGADNCSMIYSIKSDDIQANYKYSTKEKEKNQETAIAYTAVASALGAGVGAGIGMAAATQNALGFGAIGMITPPAIVLGSYLYSIASLDIKKRDFRYMSDVFDQAREGSGLELAKFLDDPEFRGREKQIIQILHAGNWSFELCRKARFTAYDDYESLASSDAVRDHIKKQIRVASASATSDRNDSKKDIFDSASRLPSEDNIDAQMAF